MLDIRRHQTAAGLFLLDPAEPVMSRQLPLGHVDRKNLDGRNLGRACLFALATSRAVLGMHHRNEQRMPARAGVGLRCRCVIALSITGQTR
jgi:hypothetical protein